jgi:hypothetical protein
MKKILVSLIAFCGFAGLARADLMPSPVETVSVLFVLGAFIAAIAVVAWLIIRMVRKKLLGRKKR